ncbi:hypothetical protein [Citrobacter sp. Cu096]|uniref:hypothetical protein n=1 Tax=Citrobacter sp. Cu096 TaxID=2985158 RepID=UPI002578F6B8|nr:hypothetical protein [Citrobacter sp. Cu096]MDM2743019.1 hypothetical protein [Citrobacter sp. Cu096]
MNEKLTELKEKLDNLHTTLNGLVFPVEDFINLGPYTFPFLHKEDLIELPKMLSDRINQMQEFAPSSDDIAVIDALIYTLDHAQQNINHINNGNAAVQQTAIPSYIISMLYISYRINDLFSFERLKDRNLLPKQILRRLELYNSGMSAIEAKTGNIEEKIKTINEAYDAAENLPTTVKMLRETNDEVKNVYNSAVEHCRNINGMLKETEESSKIVDEARQEILALKENATKDAKDYLHSLSEEAQGYINKCEEAFRTTTSKGLAGAFQDKAEKLNRSIRWWVGGLIGALVAGAAVGYTRLHALEAYLSNPDSSGIKLTIQLLLSILSVGAPLWFAWLATKQIGQRFRLAEDYEFKASVSKAYEGYRREAVQLDSDFTQRLFGNALTRLEEPPLRFVEEATHSSPIMEMLSSENFKNFLANSGDKIDSVLEGAGLSRKGKVEQTRQLNKEVTQPVNETSNKTEND